MGILSLYLAAALLFVGKDQAPLRTGCDDSDELVARVTAGTPVAIRFAVNGCYSVRVGDHVGYLPAAALEGLETWEAERRQARSVDAPAGAPPVPATLGLSPLSNASQLLRTNRPGEALTLLERALAQSPRDAGLLKMAGLAAWRADRTVQAIGYWKDAQAIRPDPEVAALLAKAEREAAADRGTQTLESTRFSLRYEPQVMTTEVARSLTGVLEQELSRISLDLGCQTAERLSATAQSRSAYLSATGAAEWSGGQFDGRIRVAVLEEGAVGAETRKRFSHELVHACLAGTGRWPAWLHEGLAQRLSGETLTPEIRAEVRAAAQSGALPPLGQMNQNWSRLSADHARLAYASALFAVELFYLHHKEFGIRTLVRNPEFLDRIEADLDQRMRT
ncbi:MAG: hypothetical protein NTV52_25165 [Acidobacteria bacterium]|nr:hypothetical protein [Acidobacteriota bacterium]